MKKHTRQKETPAILADHIARQKDPRQGRVSRADGELTMSDVAKELNIHRDTLKRWIKKGEIPDPRRNSRNAYRIFTRDDVKEISMIMQRRNDMTLNGGSGRANRKRDVQSAQEGGGS